MMSVFTAVRTGFRQVHLIKGEYSVDMVRSKMESGEPLEVILFITELQENRIVKIDNLREEKDAWGTPRIFGTIVESDGVIDASLYEDFMEAFTA